VDQTTAPTTLPDSGSITLSGDFEADKAAYESSPEYIEQNGLALINASSAYARGATGEGALIGIMDSGVDTSHQELDGLYKLTDDSYLEYSSRSPTTEEKRHGTHVAAIALGERDGSGMHGVAFDAQLFFISIELGTAGEEYEPVTIDPTVDFSAIDNSWSNLESYFIDRQVTVVNGSFGYQGNINDYTEANLRQAFPNTIDVLAQVNTPDADKTIFVWAAGNGGGYADQGVDYSSPEVFGGLAYLITELSTHSVAVVSVDPDGTISSFSNLCGVAKDYCLAAPGRSITSAYAEDAPNTSYYAAFSGTSMAAPHVSGGIALLTDYFDGQLGNTEILNRLFRTANKAGIYADSSIYGQGLMDLDAATKPLGQTMIAVTSSLDGLYHTELGTSIGSLGPVFGDAFIHAISNKSFTVFDQLGAPFIKKLDSTYLNKMPSLAWLSSQQSNPSKRILELKTNPNRTTELIFGLASDGYGEHDLFMSLWAKNDKKLEYFSVKKELSESSFYFFGKGLSPSLFFGDDEINTSFSNFSGRSLSYGSPFLDFASNGSFIGGGIKFGSNSGLSGVYFKGNHKEEEMSLLKLPNTSGVLLEYKENYTDSLMSVQIGILREPKSFLGSSFSGGYGLIDETLTYFSGFQTSLTYEEFYATGSVFYGKTQTNLTETGLIKSLNTFTSSSFNLGIFKNNLFNSSDSLGLKIIQPLRLEEADIKLSIPVRRTKYREVLFDEYDLSLTPSGREIRAELVYQRSIPRGNLYTSFGYVKDQGHTFKNKAEPYFSANWQFYLF
jgi:hypothetical protein